MNRPGERRIQDIGRQLLILEQQQAKKNENRWVKWFLDKIMENDRFRVQALRFVDVLPTLTNDGDLHQHLQEYFHSDEFNLPGIVRWSMRHPGMSKRLTAKIVRHLMRQFAKYYLGGATTDEAFKTIRHLRRNQMGFSLDLLGEAVVSEEEAEHYKNTYLELIDSLPAKIKQLEPQPLLDLERGRALPLLYLSLKPSSLYSQLNTLDFCGSYQGIAERLRTIFVAARQNHVAVCLDMEQYDYKNVVVDCFKRLLLEPEFRDWSDAGIAIQAYLKDSENDLANLIDWAKERETPITIRLVRGAYWDYETVIAKQNGWPVPVWENKWQTDLNYENCLALLFENHETVRAAVATHNVRSIALTMALAEHHSLAKDQYEFQMLYGMAPNLQRVLPQQGHCLRVYVPFGDPLPGMAYLVRRLLENASSQSFQRLSLSQQSSAEELLTPPQMHNPGPKRSTPDSKSPRFVSDLSPFRNESLFRFTEANQRQLFAETVASVRNQLGATYPMIINGHSVKSANYIESINPALPSELVGRVTNADTHHAKLAIEGALTAFTAWSSRGIEKRAWLLLKAAELLQNRRMEFAALEIFEAGKTWREADANVTEAIDFLNYYAREALRLLQTKPRNVPGETNLLWYRPRGIGIIIPPWNFPLAILTGMLSAAIVTGNVVLLKPSSQTPVIAAKFVSLLMDAGIPAGVVQFLPGPGRSLGEYLVQHPKVHFIVFTGSKEVGTRIVRLASELTPGQHHVKKVIAEMGGKNAIIVDSDADLDEAVPGIVQSAFGYQGQKCSACSRVIVVGSHYDLLANRLVAAARSLKLGCPEGPGVFMGPVIDAYAKQRILDAIEQGEKESELVLKTDCSRLGNGFFVGPTLFSKVPPASSLAQHEIFGPVLSLMPAHNFDEALDIANKSPYALTGGLYSRSPANIGRAKALFQVGNLYINRPITGALVDRQPFGGFKLSGISSKAGGADYLLQFLNPCTFTEKTLRRGFAPDFNH